MAFEISGKVIEILPVNQVSDKFRKREFVIEKKESGSGGAVFVDYVKFQLIQDKCDLINESFMNEEVKVWFNLRGNRWDKEGKVSYFTNLDAWKLEKLSGPVREQIAPPGNTLDDVPPEVDDLSDLPF